MVSARIIYLIFMIPVIAHAAHQEEHIQMPSTQTPQLYSSKRFVLSEELKYLSTEEKSRPALERIQEKFMGEIPHRIKQLIKHFDNYDEYNKLEKDTCNTILLYGPPGSGKTHLVVTMAQELEMIFYQLSAAQFSSKYIGETASNIRQLFKEIIADMTPCIVFIDEIDALGSTRNNQDHMEHSAALTTLLIELQRVMYNKDIVVIMATNDPDALDLAIKDRFSTHCHIRPLDNAQRERALTKLFRDKKLEADQGLIKRLASATGPYIIQKSMQTPGVPYDQRRIYQQERHFSNRELEALVIKAKEDFIIDRKENPQSQKTLCAFFSDVFKDMQAHDKTLCSAFTFNCNGL